MRENMGTPANKREKRKGNGIIAGRGTQCRIFWNGKRDGRGTENGTRYGCRLLPVRLMADCPAHGGAESRNATGRTAEGAGQAGRRTVAPMCPADGNGTAGGCRCAHGIPSGRVSGEIATGAPCPNPSGGMAHGCRLSVRLMADCPARSPRAARQTVAAARERHRANGAGHRNAAADRDGREPVRRTGTPRRTVAALFPAIVSEPVRRTVSGEIGTGGAADGGEIGTPAPLPDVAHGRRTRATADRDRQAGRTRQTTAASDRQRRARFQVPFKAS